MKKLFFYTYFFLCFNIYAQSNSHKKIAYIDENLIEIDSILFGKKCVSNVLKCLKYTGDSIYQVNKVQFKYYFGKITTIEAKQLKKLLVKNNDRVFNLNSNIIVSFRDSLYDYGAQKKFSLRHQKSHTIFKHETLNPKRFNSQRKEWIKGQKKCLKKMFKKFGAETFHIYNYDYGSINDYPDLNWIKDRGSFKNLFFNTKYINGSLLILKPNGEYFVSGGHFSDEMLKSLLQNDWTQYKKDLENSYKSLNRYGIGLFETNFPIHKKHCF